MKKTTDYARKSLPKGQAHDKVCYEPNLFERQKMTPEELEQQEYINQLSDSELKELWEDMIASDAIERIKDGLL